jgi:AraC-like DNA-binding protein
MKEKIKHYDYVSLHGISKSGINDIFVFDDFHSFAEKFNNIINYPVRLGMTIAIICKKGHFKLRVGMDDFVVKSDMLMIILPEQIIQLIETSPDFEGGYILLKSRFFDVQNDFKMALGLQSHLLKQPLIQLSCKEMEEVMFVFNTIKRKIEENNTLFLKELIQTYIRILFYLFVEILLKTKEPSVMTRKEEIFEKFISLLGQHFRKEQNVGWYAEKNFITPKYLSKLIFEVSGKHAGEWIKDYIILEAQALLNSSSLTVLQISDELGFSNQSHFGSYFKRYVGVSPSGYKHGGKSNLSK